MSKTHVAYVLRYKTDTVEGGCRYLYEGGDDWGVDLNKAARFSRNQACAEYFRIMDTSIRSCNPKIIECTVTFREIEIEVS